VSNCAYAICPSTTVELYLWHRARIWEGNRTTLQYFIILVHLIVLDCRRHFFSCISYFDHCSYSVTKPWVVTSSDQCHTINWLFENGLEYLNIHIYRLKQWLIFYFLHFNLFPFWYWQHSRRIFIARSSLLLIQNRFTSQMYLKICKSLIFLNK